MYRRLDELDGLAWDDVRPHAVKHMQNKHAQTYSNARARFECWDFHMARYWQNRAAVESRKTRTCLMLLLGATWDEAWRA